MRIVVQRVARASVTINGQDKKQTGKGLVALVGIGENDTERDAQIIADKLVNLRIFPNEQGKFDKSVLDVKGDILIVSQFTLYGDASKGRRPDFTKAAQPEKAVLLYEQFIKVVQASGCTVKTGEFAADMMVEIQNDGPVTILLDTETL